MKDEIPALAVEMNFCRRCGNKLAPQGNQTVFKCEQGHIIFLNAAPAVGAILHNDKGVLILERAIDPGKGLLDIPGGFCDGAETVEAALSREIEEEVGLSPNQYSAPKFLSTGIDAYGYGNEVLPVISIIFESTLSMTAEPRAADDAASAGFVLWQDIDLDKVYFPAERQSLEKLLDKYA